MSFPEPQPATGSITTPVVPEATHHAARRRRWPLLVAAAVVIALVAVGAVAAYMLTRPKPADPLSTTNLITACREAAKRQLRSPSSAQFSDEKTSQLSETRMRVWGVVDAQNGFGAQIRNRYTCEADRGEQSWIAQSVWFSDWP